MSASKAEIRAMLEEIVLSHERIALAKQAFQAAQKAHADAASARGIAENDIVEALDLLADGKARHLALGDYRFRVSKECSGTPRVEVTVVERFDAEDDA